MKLLSVALWLVLLVVLVGSDIQNWREHAKHAQPYTSATASAAP